MNECKCCGAELTKWELEEGQEKCFPCLKGNCEVCKYDGYEDTIKEDL